MEFFMHITTASSGTALAALATVLLAGCASPPPAAPVSPIPPTASSSGTTVRGPEVVADSLEIPWDIAFLPSGDLLVTERPGRLLRIGSDRKSYPIEGVRHVGEGGLLGVALHPQFASNGFVYLYITTRAGQGLSNRIERYRLDDDRLTDRTDIFTGIPGAQYHDGGRIAFGPDGMLYATTGDAGDEDAAQQTGSLAGKILRIADDGSIPADNPFGNAVWSYGHRNAQGLSWDPQGRLWSTEHGRSGLASGYDELNLIEKGGNYGWPVIEGPETRDDMRAPILQSGAQSTWAPASAAFYEGSVFFGGLRGEALYEAVLNDTGMPVLRTHLQGEYGRIRTVGLGPDGLLYLTTSNRDGRGRANEDDDKIIRIDPETLP